MIPEFFYSKKTHVMNVPKRVLLKTHNPWTVEATETSLINRPTAETVVSVSYS